MADGSPVVQGTAAAAGNVSGSGTLLSCSLAGSISLSVDQQNGGTAVYATGRGGGGAGVIALSEQDYGVYGYAAGREFGVGVHGTALGSRGVAVRGYALQNIGVSGETSARGSIGVKGESGIGVWGTSPRSFGIGVEGDATADNSIGVYGSCGGSRGIGVYATAPAADSFALQVNGRLGLSSSGRLQIAARRDQRDPDRHHPIPVVDGPGNPAGQPARRADPGRRARPGRPAR